MRRSLEDEAVEAALLACSDEALTDEAIEACVSACEAAADGAEAARRIARAVLDQMLRERRARAEVLLLDCSDDEVERLRALVDAQLDALEQRGRTLIESRR